MKTTIKPMRPLRILAAGALAASLSLGVATAAHADPTPMTGQPCTYLASPGYYLNNGTYGRAGGFPRITPLLSYLPVSLTSSQITGLENNGVGGGQPDESGAQFFTIDLNLASYIKANNLNPASVQVTYNGTNVIQTLTTLAGLLDANGMISSANSQTFQNDLAPIINLADEQNASCGLTITPGGPGGGGAPTPELGSGELLATGLLPIGAVLLYRRRRRAS